MSDGSKTGRRLSRRKMLALTLSGTAAGLAGCSGGGDNDTTTSGGDTTTGGGSGTTASGSTTTSGGSGTSMGGSTSATTGGTTAGGTSAEGTNEGTSAGTQGTSQQGTQMSPDQMAEKTINKNSGYLPQEANWNHFAKGPLTSFFVWDKTSETYWNGETDWWLLKEDGYNYDQKSKTATYDFREDYGYWWNGDPVTAKDYWTTQELNRLRDPEGNPWKSWELEDKYTLKGKRKKKINPEMLGNGGGRLLDYRNYANKWIESYQDDTTQDARDKTHSKILNYKMSTKEFVDKGLANGTYKLEDWSTTEMIWKKFEKHPFADQVQIPKVKFNIGSGSAQNQQITQDKLDIGSGRFPGELRQSSPEYLKTIYQKRSIQGRNLLFNYNNKHIGRRNVRRALVSILDFNRLVDFWNGKGGPVKQRQTGLPKALEDKWLGDELVNKMVNYPLKSDKQQAEKFMKKAGYEKQGGTWVGPDGDPLKFTLMIGTYLTSEALGKALAQAWKQWGAKVKLLPVTNSQWTGKIFTPQGDWGVTVFLHGFDTLNAYNFFSSTNPYHMRLGKSGSDIQKWLDEGKTHSPLNGKPLTPTIPSTPGLEVEGDGKQINIYELIEGFLTTQKEDHGQENIRLLSRYFNYDLPMFDMFPQIAAIWGDTKNFTWPDDPDKVNSWQQKSSRAEYASLRKGIVGPASKQ